MLLAVTAQTLDAWAFSDDSEADVAICEIDSPLASVTVARARHAGRPHCIWLVPPETTRANRRRLDDPIASTSLIALLDEVSGELEPVVVVGQSPSTAAAFAAISSRPSQPCSALDLFATILRDLLHHAGDPVRIIKHGIELHVVSGAPARSACRTTCLEAVLKRLVDLSPRRPHRARAGPGSPAPADPCGASSTICSGWSASLAAVSTSPRRSPTHSPSAEAVARLRPAVARAAPHAAHRTARTPAAHRRRARLSSSAASAIDVARVPERRRAVRPGGHAADAAPTRPPTRPPSGVDASATAASFYPSGRARSRRATDHEPTRIQADLRRQHGAGKTTAIRAISEIPSRPHRRLTTAIASSHEKATTTAALDYGEVTLSVGDKLRLYGTPVQLRFDFMWQILAESALGVVLLVDNSRPIPPTTCAPICAPSARPSPGAGRWSVSDAPTRTRCRRWTRFTRSRTSAA